MPPQHSNSLCRKRPSDQVVARKLAARNIRRMKGMRAHRVRQAIVPVLPSALLIPVTSSVVHRRVDRAEALASSIAPPILRPGSGSASAADDFRSARRPSPLQRSSRRISLAKTGRPAEMRAASNSSASKFCSVDNQELWTQSTMSGQDATVGRDSDASHSSASFWVTAQRRARNP